MACLVRRTFALRFAATMIFAIAAASCADETKPTVAPAAVATADAPAAVEKPATPAAVAPAPSPKPADLFPHNPEDDRPVVSPFGDRYDPLRPPPVAPEPSGAGITSAKVVAAGAADIQEIPRPAGSASVFYGAVVEVSIAPGSTTAILGPTSVTLEAATGEPVALFAACTPTLEDAEAITHGEGTKMAGWTVAIDGRTWRCGGRTARMALRVGPGGFKLTAPAPAGWSGPLVLLFEAQAAPPKSVTITARTAEIPAKQDEKKN